MADVLMIDYSQPSFYHFSEDSLTLAKFILSLNLTKEISFLEFGSGCGVIGIELAQDQPLWQGTLIEVQSEFIGHINSNIATFKVNHLDVKNINVEDFSVEEQVDLIFFNPPYFLEGAGRTPDNRQKQICRHIGLCDIYNWFLKAQDLLFIGGKLCYCLPVDSPFKNIWDHLGFEEESSKVIGKVEYKCLRKV